MKKIACNTPAQDIWKISGSFEALFGEITVKENGAEATRSEYRLTCDIQSFDGVKVRCDTFTNTSDKTLYITGLSSRFTFDGGEYEVYTQFDGWCNESKGAWQPLITSVASYTQGLWGAINSTPMLALWNKQTSRGTVFHIVCDSAWKINAAKRHFHGANARVTVDAGMDANDIMIEVKPGESVDFPEIIYYEFTNRTDLDCHKLHSYCHKRYPKKAPVVMYNTWLCDFHKLTFDSVVKQIQPASDMGCEYFIIDSGWYWKDDDGWNTSRGDWQEHDTFGLKGRMSEIADLVRQNGMKFGFWMEPVVAGNKSEAIQKYPQYFLYENNKYMLDFSNPDAVDYITDITFGLIDKYKAEFIKFDFNQELTFDKDHAAFKNYFKGLREYFKRLQKQHPEVYLEGCAGGGANLALSAMKDYDSYWLSDNQSVYNSLRIFKDTILRLPPQMMDKWITAGCYPQFPSFIEEQLHDKIFSTDDATFTRAVEVKPDFLHGFMLGSAIGFSCDLTAFTDSVKDGMKKTVETFKSEREFWRSAVCRILCDTESMLVLQYSDEELKKIKIAVFSLDSYQDNIRIYPVVRPDTPYTIDAVGEGIDVAIPDKYRCTVIEFEMK